MGFPFFQGYIVVRQNKCSEDRPLGKMKYILLYKSHVIYVEEKLKRN